jgi:flap endonuclease-1
MEMERLSRLSQLAPLVTTFESLPKEERAAVATSLLQVPDDLPADQHTIDGMTFEFGPNEAMVEPHPGEPADTPSISDIPPRPATRKDTVDSALEEATSDLSTLTIATKSDPEPPPTKNVVNQVEKPLIHNPTRVSSMLAALYSRFLASVRQMGTLLSSRTVVPRPEDQDDETEVTQELSQAQRRLVVDEESMWKRLSETANEEDAEGGVSLLARELEERSTKILTSYERRNDPPTSEVYGQCRTILKAMGVPCIDSEGGVEGEALASAIVRNGFADYVASEDTVCFPPPFK